MSGDPNDTPKVRCLKQGVVGYPVVIITCVHYLGPPVPFSFPDSRDLLEVLRGLSWQRESPQGGSPRVREDPLGTPPPSLSAKKVLREPREGPENLGRRRYWRSEIMNASNNDYWVDELSCKPCLKFVGAVYICSARRKKTCTRSSFSSTVC